MHQTKQFASVGGCQSVLFQWPPADLLRRDSDRYYFFHPYSDYRNGSTSPTLRFDIHIHIHFYIHTISRCDCTCMETMRECFLFILSLCFFCVGGLVWVHSLRLAMVFLVCFRGRLTIQFNIVCCILHSIVLIRLVRTISKVPKWRWTERGPSDGHPIDVER